MPIIKRIALSFFAVILIVGFVACEKEGPMEKAGKKADQVVDDVQKAVKKKTEQLEAIKGGSGIYSATRWNRYITYV